MPSTDLIQLPLMTREEVEVIDQLGSGQVFIFASQRELAQSVKDKARNALHGEAGEGPEGIEQMAAEQGPRWRSRKEAWLDGFRHGEQHARMTGADRPTQPTPSVDEGEDIPAPNWFPSTWEGKKP